MNERSVRWRAGARVACVALLALTCATGGCALWTPANDKGIKHIWLQTTLTVPDGWMVATFSEGLFATKHGIEVPAPVDPESEPDE